MGSLSADGVLPLQKGVSFSGSAEYAQSHYLDDTDHDAGIYDDWAFLGNAAVIVQGVQLKMKYISNGPNFFSPGAQTNQYSPNGAVTGYINSNQNLDDALMGYLNGYVFQNVARPSFAPYDRMMENALPYGDATPNREGYVLGFSADIGKGGWVKPQASCLVNMHEIQPDYVYVSIGGGTGVCRWIAALLKLTPVPLPDMRGPSPSISPRASRAFRLPSTLRSTTNTRKRTWGWGRLPSAWIPS